MAPEAPLWRRLRAGGPEGNERLTSTTAAVLLVLLAVEGVTILSLRTLISVHMFVGMLLIPPIALKMASTGYRFVRYYGGSPAYRQKGPPAMGLRLIAPIVVITSVVMLASGVGLLFAGPISRDTLLPIHRLSFFIWVAFTGVHVLAHLPRIPAALRADYRTPERELSRSQGRGGRGLAVLLALSAGVLLAVLVLSQFAPWQHFEQIRHAEHIRHAAAG